MRIRALLLTLALTVSAAAQVSPYTGKGVVPPDSAGRYRLLIGGHFHGASSNMSGYPAATVLAGMDLINGTRANAFLSTGDLFLRPDRDSLRYAQSFFGKLQLPLFNAPGNHDLEGKAYHTPMPQRIDMGRDRILLLDTERDDSDIQGDQLEALRELVSEVEQGVAQRLIIVTHRPIWAEGDERYGRLFAGNTRSITGCNFQAEVLPLLRKAASRSAVYWISGSMAGRAPASVFFQPHEKNITYIQSAVRDELRDALLLADVTPDSVRWEVRSLTGESVQAATAYDAAWWEAHQGKAEEFHWRRIPYLVRKNLTSAVFWFGAVAMLVVLALVRLLMRARGNRASRTTL